MEALYGQEDEPFKESIRQTLRDVAGSANSPFVSEQDAFFDCTTNKRARTVRWALIVGEDDYLPQPKHWKKIIERGQYAFSAGTAAHRTYDGSAADYSFIPVTTYPRSLQTRLSDGTTRRGVNRLRRHAELVLQDRRDDYFSTTVIDWAEGARKGLSGSDAYVLRLGALGENVAGRLLNLVERGAIAAVVGLNIDQPDLSNDVLYEAVKGEAVKGVIETRDDDTSFTVPTDIQVTRTLKPGWRTGLFRRTRNSTGSEVVTCYALLDSNFPPTCLDIVTMPDRRADVVTRVVTSLVAERRIVTTGLPELFGTRVAFPESAQEVLRTLRHKRNANPVEKFYEGP
jgi:hypothetical protein